MQRVGLPWRRALRSAVLLVLAALAFLATKTFLWAPLSLLAAFFFAVDVYAIDKRKPSDGGVTRDAPATYGVLGDYVVDETPSFGLFIRLCDRPVFVDIRRDRLEQARKRRAEFLYEHQTELNEALQQFLESHPQFAVRSIQSVGLHAEIIEQGEVFWDPDGHTLLKGMTFSA